MFVIIMFFAEVLTQLLLQSLPINGVKTGIFKIITICV